ncbi:NfeD family protein [Basilea psittacipulmonis]|uniref:NfeD-like C-terminal domain-containing protein n=1 Tax=Basilea psittacipulmonis DSM 24701 TaxID=1072685 RepID=A0A077DJ26_9BURK|nr:NfeD family protein [Basilea psittacipulmonis]AIL33138.1 hypothetical protein IX83_07365 [Basilea psittacipulmonis DSM 24701]
MSFEAYWGYLIIACLMLLLEVLAPALLGIFLAIASVVVALICYVMPDLDLAWQLCWYAVLSLLSFISWFYWGRHLIKKEKNDSASYLNNRAYHLLNRTIVLQSPITNGIGSEFIDGSRWSLKGDDLPQGTAVKIIDVDNMYLVVEKV